MTIKLVTLKREVSFKAYLNELFGLSEGFD